MNRKSLGIGTAIILAVMVTWWSKTIISAIWRLVKFILHVIVLIILAIPDWATSLAKTIIAILVPLGALVIVLFAGGVALWLLMLGLAALTSEVSRLGRIVANQAGQAAADAGFVAILAAGAATIAYMTTNDFLDFSQFVTLKIMALASVACCIGKMSMMIPARPAKISGFGMIIFSLISAAGFAYHRLHLIDIKIIELVGVRGFVLLFIILTTGIAVFYPFTPSGWKRLLS